MTEVRSIARMKIHDGKLDEFKPPRSCLRDLFARRTRERCSTTTSSTTINLVCRGQRYRDFDAFREHLANIGDDIMQALFKVCSLSGDIFTTPMPS